MTRKKVAQSSCVPFMDLVRQLDQPNLLGAELLAELVHCGRQQESRPTVIAARANELNDRKQIGEHQEERQASQGSAVREQGYACQT